MKSSEPISDYADSVGRVREQLEQLDGRQPGDPARAARAIVKAVEAADPPRRLPLGTMALERIRAKLTAPAPRARSLGRTERIKRLPDSGACKRGKGYVMTDQRGAGLVQSAYSVDR